MAGGRNTDHIVLAGCLTMKKEWFMESKHGDRAVLLRNRRAKELRQEGYEVTCKKWDFTDIARDIGYSLEYGRKTHGTNP